jgi:two-component system, cell cycle response regulator DivK
VEAAILVVEDNRDNMELMEYLLKAFGYTPKLATGGAEAVRCAREQPPDLILMDVQMPDMDGHEARDEIRKQPGLEGCTIVAVTAFAMLGDQERILAAGFDGYISKPIAPESFVGQVERFLAPELHARTNGAQSGP